MYFIREPRACSVEDDAQRSPTLFTFELNELVYVGELPMVKLVVGLAIATDHIDVRFKAFVRPLYCPILKRSFHG